MAVLTRTTSHGALALHYERRVTGGRASGEPVVFINSLGTDFRLWDPITPHLPSGLDMILYDKRGHGLSDAPPAPYVMDEHVEDLTTILDRLSVGRVNLVGLSIGGLIAQGFALAHPERVRSLALCDTGAKIGTEEMWNERIAAVRANGLASIADGVLARWFSERFRAEDASFALWRNMLVRTPAEGYAACGMSIRDADFRGRGGEITAPSLCVCGSVDGATPPALVQALAGAIPDSRYVEIEGVGHLPCVEAPERMAETLTEFWRGHGVI